MQELQVPELEVLTGSSREGIHKYHTQSLLLASLLDQDKKEDSETEGTAQNAYIGLGHRWSR